MKSRPRGFGPMLGATLVCLGAANAHADALPQVPVFEHRLDNGLTVLLSPDNRLPLVAVEVRYLVGSANERAGRTGFAHLFEHLMFQGTANFDQEYFAPFEPIGASVNGTTSQDRTNYYETVPKNYLDLALWMQSDRLESFLPALTQAKLDNQRDVVKNERRMRIENRPYGTALMRLTEALYPVGHPYHHPVIGSHVDLTAASLADVQAFFRTYYAPSNAVLTIVGDIEPRVTLARVRHYFGHLSAGRRAPKPLAPKPEVRGPMHVVEEDKVPLPRVYLGWHTPAAYAPGDAALDVLSTLLSGGKTSRLYQPLVYERRVAKDVAAYQLSRAHGSMFVVQATATPGTTVDVLAKSLETTLRQALASMPSADEMARAQNGWRKVFFGSLEGVMSRAQVLSSYWHVAGRADYLAEDFARYDALTPNDVFAAGQRYLTPQRVVRLDVLPAKGVEG